MLSNYSKVTNWFLRGNARLIFLPLWVLAGFVVAYLVVEVAIWVLGASGVRFSGMDTNLLQTVFSLIVYGLAILIVIVLPNSRRWLKTSLKELGWVGLPTWLDILLPIAGFFVYLLLSVVLSWLASFLPWYSTATQQDVGFSNLAHYGDYLLAFLCLVVLAPIAEETLFRGFLFGKLRRWSKVWLATLITSLTFAVAHMSWTVGVDVFALSLVLCTLRAMSGSLWAPVLLHMIKNGLAFYLLFINPGF